MAYKGHVYFEAVQPELLNQALMYLKENNPLYSDASVDVGNIPDNLLSFANDDIPGQSGTAEDSTSFSAGTGSKISYKTACHRKSFITHSKLIIF